MRPRGRVTLITEIMWFSRVSVLGSCDKALLLTALNIILMFWLLALCRTVLMQLLRPQLTIMLVFTSWVNLKPVLCMAAKICVLTVPVIRTVIRFMFFVLLRTRTSLFISSVVCMASVL